jgi:HK97 family phage major capsid protein
MDTPKISPELKTALEGLESTFTTAQKELDLKMEKLGSDSADYQEYKAKSVKDMEDVSKSIDEIKAAMARAPAANTDPEKKELTAEEKAFRSYLFKGADISHEQKTLLQVGDDERGGYLVTPEIGAIIDQLQREVSPMRSLVNVITINGGDAIEAPTITSKTIGATRRNETASSTDNSNVKFGNKRIAVNWLDALVPATIQAADDIPQLISLLGQFAAEDFAITEGAEVLNGTGVGQGRGLMTAGTGIEQISSGAAAAFTTTGLLSLVGGLKTAYRANSSFIANRSTIFTQLFGLQDAEERHYLVPDFRNGFQFTLLGFPLIEMPDMPDSAADALPLAFGNFKRAYNWVERKQMSLFVDPFTSHPTTKYIWSKRSGGDVVVAEALKIQKIAS